VLISRSVLTDVLAHAVEDAPRECCGLLVGTAGSIVRSVRARNLEHGTTRYTIDPKDHFNAIRAARVDGLDVVGAYHSHPLSAASPSPTDIAEANSGADFVYVIVSVVSADVRAFRIAAGHFEQVPLISDP
jgi:proteasome lid subunit RPN8/RPN11